MDTPIPTAAGWSTMGSLCVGNSVFDELGRLCTVVAATEEMRGRQCLGVTFDDGSRIVADADHVWAVSPRKNRKRGSRDLVTMSTAMMMATHRCGSDQRANYAIPTAAPLSYGGGNSLPVHPYVLGVWLGNGTTVAPQITDGDGWIRGEIERLGYRTSTHSQPYTYGVFMPDGEGSLRTQLVKLGVLGNKHIPEIYLRAATANRWALLQGLMDTDGTCGKARSPRCEFAVTKRALADGFYDLAIGLGLKAARDERPAMLRGKRCGTSYRISFTTTAPVFRYPRKRGRLPAVVKSVVCARYVTAVEPVESVPVRCIQVDSPSRLFLAGEGCIPTHNSSFARALRDRGIPTLCTDPRPLVKDPEEGVEYLPDEYADRSMWSAASEYVARNYFAREGPWCIDGVASARALRKWLVLDLDERPAPCDQIILFANPVVELTSGQAAMTAGVWTVWAEVREYFEKVCLVTEVGDGIGLMARGTKDGDEQ